MKHIDGDLLKLADAGQFDVIVHGCNCYCTMGAGIARSIADRWPCAEAMDNNTPRGKDKRGMSTFVEVQTAADTKLIVVNAYTQYGFGHGACDYAAIEKCLAGVIRHWGHLRIGLPEIGCGLAGGEWPKVQAILDRVAPSTCDFTVVHYKKG